MRERTIGHLSHGVAETGGYHHEQKLMSVLADDFSSRGILIGLNTQRFKRYFSGLSHLKLQLWSFKRASFDINIVTVRCALSAIVRNIGSQKKVFVVLHNHDANDHNGGMLSVYHRLLFWVLRKVPFNNVAIVTGAPYWVRYFEQKVNNNVPVFLFPSLFDLTLYESYKIVAKKKQINLGQFSRKNDNRIFALAKMLKAKGYTCYFSTMVKQDQGVFDDYEVRFCSFEYYLTSMAESLYTIAYTAVNEGWNRVAHESLLVGTPVIGVNKAGLGDLLRESGSAAALTETDFLNIITRQQPAVTNTGFLKKYDTSTALQWVKPLALFCESK